MLTGGCRCGHLVDEAVFERMSRGDAHDLVHDLHGPACAERVAEFDALGIGGHVEPQRGSDRGEQPLDRGPALGERGSRTDEPLVTAELAQRLPPDPLDRVGQVRISESLEDRERGRPSARLR